MEPKDRGSSVRHFERPGIIIETETKTNDKKKPAIKLENFIWPSLGSLSY